MDMSKVIIPDSTQINADELQTGPITVKIAAVKIKGGKEQPVDIVLDGMQKVYRPCKGMCRLIVGAWGANAADYVGRSMTLYCDPTVRWGGLAVGGIRISHMSHLSEDMTMAITITRASKKPYTVRPLQVAKPSPAAPSHLPPAGTPSDSETAAVGLINAAELKAIEIVVEMKGIKGRFDTRLRANGIKSPDQIPAHLVEKFKKWVEDAE